MSPRIDRPDLPWVALVAVSFVFGLIMSWERWGNPLVDCGREMNQPLRLLRGEVLYSDVRHIYAPLSPYLNSLLYAVFDPSLTVLYFSGIVTAILILALTYWLSRQLMGTAAAAAATLSVTWLCAFKQAGNYILPYSYSAVHACALGLASLAASIAFINRSFDSNSRGGRLSTLLLVSSGLLAGLTLLAKTEMGLAALVSGIAAGALVGYPSPGRILRFCAAFLGTAIGLAGGVYGVLIWQVGWYTLSVESFLFLQNLPEELVYFNKRMSGFDRPLESLVQMSGALFRVAALAVVIALITLLATRRREPETGLVAERAAGNIGRASLPQVWLLGVLSLMVVIGVWVGDGIDWDKGPYLAMPVLLAGLVFTGMAAYQRRITSGSRPDARTVVLLVVALYALASLARVLLRVRSGGAYSSYLLPASVILFTFFWVEWFAGLFRDRRASRLAAGIAISLILFDVALTAGLISHKFRTRNTHPIRTERGVIIALPDLGEAFNQAIGYISRETSPGDHVAVLPEGTSLNFFTDRPNPLREEITTPGFLDEKGEERAIRQLIETDTRLVLVANRLTSEFGAPVIGRDYNRKLMEWVETNFEQVAVFGPNQDPDQRIGDSIFFLRAYRR